MPKYSKTFKVAALRMSDKIGLKKTAEELEMPYYTPADWRHERNRMR